MDNQPSFFEKMGSWIRGSVTFKIFSIAFLILILLIPTGMVEDLIWERQDRQQTAVNEISSKWGYSQLVSGPIISVPYDVYDKNEKNEIVKFIRYAHFLPDNLSINGKVMPEVRYRGIFEAVLYSSDLKISGKFSKPDFSSWKIDPDNVRWDEALLSLGIPDMRGINDQLDLKWGDKTISFEPGIPIKDVLQNGVSVRIDLSDSTITDQTLFSLDLSLNGSSSLEFLPLGKTTTISLNSEWKNPSFVGQFLPDDRNISESGFEATWKILQLNRNYPQQWLGAAFNPSTSAFGVELIVGVDQYQKNTRMAKYAVMIISLTFVLFFFMEIINKKRIHPIQYLLVGFALSIFYTLLLSISEQLNFGLAYIIASVAVVGLITIYVHGMLKSMKLTILLAGALTLMYGFIYTILQLQDMSLLIGSIGLFIVLATIMYYTRSIDWYSITRQNE